MKFTLRLGDRENLTRENALACCSMNLVLPGGGSLLAGRRVGYAQVALCGIGFALTLIFGLKFVAWSLQHWSELRDPADPMDNLRNIWLGCRWALLGLALFGVSWVWALLTNLAILRQSRSQAQPGEKPPLIRPG